MFGEGEYGRGEFSGESDFKRLPLAARNKQTRGKLKLDRSEPSAAARGMCKLFEIKFYPVFVGTARVGRVFV